MLSHDSPEKVIFTIISDTLGWGAIQRTLSVYDKQGVIQQEEQLTESGRSVYIPIVCITAVLHLKWLFISHISVCCNQELRYQIKHNHLNLPLQSLFWPNGQNKTHLYHTY